jgi:hypothetical protein
MNYSERTRLYFEGYNESGQYRNIYIKFINKNTLVRPQQMIRI